MKKIILFLLIMTSILYGDVISDSLFNKVKCNCDKIITTKIYESCYSYKYKGPLVVAYTVNGNNVNTKNIIKRPSWRIDYGIPLQYRQLNSDYYRSGYDKGHLAADKYFDYNLTVLKMTYMLGDNTTPMNINLNRSRWRKAENRVSVLAMRYGYVHVIDLIAYGDKYIGKKVYVAKTLYKLIYNDKIKECYKYNGYLLHVVNDTLAAHEVDCDEIHYIVPIKIFK